MVLEKFDQATTKLLNGTIKLVSPKELSQYFIQDYRLIHYNPGNVEDYDYLKIYFNSYRIRKP